MLSLFVGFIGILLTIFLIVGIHEAGHFAMAKLLGVKVLRFSIGFGKALFRWQANPASTEYVIAAIPLGGYVKMLDETEGEVNSTELHLAYNQQSFYKKFLIILAGPFANLILAFVVYWLLFVIGFTTIKPIIGTVTPHSIAAAAGLKPQEEIISIDDKPVLSWISVAIRLISHTGDQDKIKIKTNTATYYLDITHWKMDELKPDPLMTLGLIPYLPDTPTISKNLISFQQYTPLAALTPAFRNVYEMTYLNFLVIGKLLTGKVSLKSLGGPITIFSSAGSAFNLGLLPFLSFLAFLSIGIGIINILPIPGLDGGHILFQCIELITRRPLSMRVQLLLYRLGVICLMLLIFQAIVNDVMRI